MTNWCKKGTKDQKQGVKDESLCFALKDLFCNLKCCNQLIMVLISIFATLLIVLYMPERSQCVYNKLEELYLSVFPCTLGFGIAAYAIICGLNSDVLKKLSEEDEEKAQPFHVICASMIFCGLLQTMTIITAFASFISHCQFVFYLATFFGSYSLLQILDILLQLLGLRTFIIGIVKKNEQKY